MGVGNISFSRGWEPGMVFDHDPHSHTYSLEGEDAIEIKSGN